MIHSFYIKHFKQNPRHVIWDVDIGSSQSKVNLHLPVRTERVSDNSFNIGI